MPRLRLLALLTVTLVVVTAGLHVNERPGPAEAAPGATASAVGDLNRNMVLVISVDGLTKNVFATMGKKQIPNLWRLMNQGASTRNARTEPEMTVTLPNHVGMVTGRRIWKGHGGHGVTWNTNRRWMTVHKAAGEWVRSVFNDVHRAGGATAVFATKTKFSIFERSWPNAIDRSVIRNRDDAGVVWRARQHLRKAKPAFTFLHLGGPDRAGHAHGWMSPGYKRAVRRTDELLGKVLRTRDNNWRLRQRLAIVLTSDHGGVPGTTGHYDRKRMANQKVPFAIHARYVDGGRNLYGLSPAYARPRSNCWCAWNSLPPHRTKQPIRNGDVANLSLRLLGLGPLKGSLWGRDQQLNWR